MLTRSSAGAAVAAAVVAIGAGGCGSSNKLTAKDRRDFVAGCARSGGTATPKACGCVYDQLRRHGYDTRDEFRTLQTKIRAGNRPAFFVDIARRCLTTT